MKIRDIKRLMSFVVGMIGFGLWLWSQQATPLSLDEITPVQDDSVIVDSKVVGEMAELVKVVDGDTIEVSIDGVKKKVRMIGINAPESVDPRRKVECFGKEASNYLKSILLIGSDVILTADSSQDDIDRYGRIIRYVQLIDGTDVNAKMIIDGYAYEYTYRVPYLKQAEYRVNQEKAEFDGKGLWSEETCDGVK